MSRPGVPDYYKILQVEPDATIDEIKASFKHLSLKYHPDKNLNDSSATSKFQDLSEAYSVLGDEEKKQKYDRLYFYDEDLSDNDEEEYDSDGNEEFCGNPFCPVHGRGSYDIFKELFTRYYARHYDEFESTFGRRRRATADWSDIPNFPTVQELKRQEVPDKLSRPSLRLIKNEIEWAKKSPRKIVTYYILERKIGNSESWIEIYKGPEKEFTDRKLEGNNTYHYRVFACNEKGKADASDSSNIVISTLSTPVKSVSQAPIQKSQTPTPPQSETKEKPKKKKNQVPKGPDPSIANCIQEIYISTHSGDKEKIKKAIKHASEFDLDWNLELSESVEKATKVLNSIIKHEKYEKLKEKLLETLPISDEEVLTAVINECQEFIREYKSGVEVTCISLNIVFTHEIALQREMRPIRDSLKSILQEKQTKQTILDEIETAKVQKDLKMLTDLIEKAKQHNIAVGDAKKFQRKLQKQQRLRSELLKAMENADIIALENAIEECSKLSESIRIEEVDQGKKLLEELKIADEMRRKQEESVRKQREKKTEDLKPKLKEENNKTIKQPIVPTPQSIPEKKNSSYPPTTQWKVKESSIQEKTIPFDFLNTNLPNPFLRSNNVIPSSQQSLSNSNSLIQDEDEENTGWGTAPQEIVNSVLGNGMDNDNVKTNGKTYRPPNTSLGTYQTNIPSFPSLFSSPFSALTPNMQPVIPPPLKVKPPPGFSIQPKTIQISTTRQQKDGNDLEKNLLFERFGL